MQRLIFSKLTVVSLLTVVCLTAPARADLNAYESFDYPDISDSLFDLEGGVGFTGQWQPYGGAPNQDNWKVVEGSLPYPGLRTEGNSVTSQAFVDGWVGIVHELDSEIDTETTKYLSFLMRPEGVADQSFGVILDGLGDLSTGMLRGSNYMMETFFNTATRFSGVQAVPGETSLMVVKAELGPGADTFTLFVNPVPGEPEPSAGTVKSDLDIGRITGIGLVASGGLSVDELRWGDTFADVTPPNTLTLLQAGDADQDLDFDQIDLVQVQVAAKYLTGQAATWGEGDWNGAQGGSPGNPPAGDGLFDQFDIVAAQQGAAYLTGPYAAVQAGGTIGDGQTSVVYNAGTGELSVDTPAGVELTSINIDSAAGIFTGEAAVNLGGSFDNDADNNIFKATFGSSFSSLRFGNVAQAGLTEEFVLDDLTVVGSLAGGGDLGSVDLIYVPEPSSVLLLSIGLAIGLAHFRRVYR